MGHDGIGAGQQSIPCQNDGSGIENSVGRGLAAPADGIVQHIVMQQRGCVQHFHGDGQAVNVVPVMAQKTRRADCQKRAQALAAGIEDMPDYWQDRSRQSLAGIVQGLVDGREFRGQACL